MRTAARGSEELVTGHTPGTERGWDARRRRFNHDWLKNGMIPSASKALNVLRGSVVDPAFECTLLSGDLFRSWDRWNDARALLSSFLAEKSPERLLKAGESPVSAGLVEGWLRDFTVGLWKRRNAVSSRLDEASDAVGEAQDAHMRLLATALTTRGSSLAELPPPVRSDLEAAFSEFVSASRRVARALEDLAQGLTPL